MIPKFPPISSSTSTDVLIVGGGITGITSAYLLAKEGKSVTLIDASHLVGGTSLHTTAKVTVQHGLCYDQLINNSDFNTAKTYLQVNQAAAKFIEGLVHTNAIECDYEKNKAVIFSTSGEYETKIEKEKQAYDHLNLKGTIETSIPYNLDIQNALQLPDQAQFNPTKYLSFLVQELIKMNVTIYENTKATAVKESEENVEVTCETGHSITANHVIISSHYPFYEGAKFLFARMYANKSYVIAFPAINSPDHGMYVSVDKPVRSIRQTTINGEDFILFGGESHKVGQGDDISKHYQALTRSAESVFGKVNVQYHWSAQDYVTEDQLPFIGPLHQDRPRTLVATGYRKWGMTNSTAAAMMLTDKILERPNTDLEIFKPTRFNLKASAKQIIRENVDVTKHFIKGKIDFPKNKIDQLQPDEATTFLKDGQRTGAYKDDEGQVHVVDTTCTHMGCEVNWNDAERTWDCPCHGSRFSYEGKVIEGPAQEALKKHDYTIKDVYSKE
ncbi:FAD-dependent oxidoreductase [Halalkalibacillus halophilus]|uniref:FAD-dependent oxidoreductase n=1 Tax=Halalkalibacillus halophilus TaxID=392827 RepID=UPI0004025016|nr:FAD-dependent oxidoreductase [Halalkalibacillus halophilus]